MQIKLGEKIRKLRQRDGRKQEDLAVALGVTNQAVSRWEANGGYPDIEMLPAIANYFHITMDELSDMKVTGKLNCSRIWNRQIKFPSMEVMHSLLIFFEIQFQSFRRNGSFSTVLRMPWYSWDIKKANHIQ